MGLVVERERIRGKELDGLRLVQPAYLFGSSNDDYVYFIALSSYTYIYDHKRLFRYKYWR